MIKAAPNEEFLKAQKQKLRELMLNNAAIENRRSLRLANKNKSKTDLKETENDKDLTQNQSNQNITHTRSN